MMVLQRPVELAVYTSTAFRALVAGLGMRSSMGRTGVCWEHQRPRRAEERWPGAPTRVPLPIRHRTRAATAGRALRAGAGAVEPIHRDNESDRLAIEQAQQEDPGLRHTPYPVPGTR